MRAPRHTNFAVTKVSKASDDPEARAKRLVKVAIADLREACRSGSFDLLENAIWNLNKARAGLKGQP